ncbi:peptidase M50 [Dactylosporangium sp. NBC_01737]|uniref:peptidase M50 n=1 Tax=Dactylosporangium sp. NBC_01737 TaxID=2975959 RepID=UPI002E0D568E|nr:peptidase M50 [Dactylosporangium sp. NBC_01737]
MTGVAGDPQDLLDARPRVRPDLLISAEMGRGPNRIHLVKIRGGRVFEVSAKESFLIRHLDGHLTVADVSDLYAARFGRRLGPAQWSQLLWLLHQRDLLAADGQTAAHPPPRPGLHRLAGAVRWAFTAPAGLAATVALLTLYTIVAVQSPHLWHAARPALQDWRSIAGVVAVCYVGAMLHELAHGVTATHFGCRVVRINLFRLTCQVEDYQYLPARAHRVAIAAAGGVLNALVTAPFVLAWSLTAPASAGHRFAAAVALAGTAQSLVNYVPVAPLDGYKMLSHQLGMIALGPESRRYLWSRPHRWLTGRGAAYPRQARIALGLYGTAWHAAAAAAGTTVAVAGGRLLEPALGRAGYAASCAAVVLTVTLWLTSQPGLRPARSRTHQPVTREARR